ncbi:MAG: hypothetical protein IJW54_06965 [Clostridia bacterium]|nr:hypothetical protein [Clostridia bacterium]
MKKLLSLLTVLVLIVSTMLVLASCQESKIPDPPEGYLMYSDNNIYFAYPENLIKTDNGNYVQLSPEEGGNNITVAKGAYNSSFDNMSVETFRTYLKPGLTQAGMTITNEKVVHNTEKGFDIAIVTYDVYAYQINMEQTLFMFRVGDLVYTLTVTALNDAEAMIDTLLETLNLR